MPNGGLASRLLGSDIREEVDKRIQTLKDALVPMLVTLVKETEKTNELLQAILTELKKKKK